MEKIIRRLFITGVILTAAGILAIPTQSYADDYTCTPSSTNTCNTGSNGNLPSAIDKTSTFNLSVGSILQLKDVTGAHITDASISEVNTDTLSATVVTNYKSYVIQLSAETPELTLQGDANQKIEPSSTVTGGTSGWGIQKVGGSGYTAITATPTTFFTSNSATTDAGTQTSFNVGIGVSPVQTPGTYGTEVTVTAIAPASLAN